MVHPLVNQLYFARKKFIEGFDGVTPAEAVKRFEPMNSLSWIIGHLSVHELRVWVEIAQGRVVAPEVLVCEGGKPASTPDFVEMMNGWQQITGAADVFLAEVTQEDMLRHFEWQGKQERENIGTMIQRNIYHYWYHLGEAQAVRQMLGHSDLPNYVGRIPPDSTYIAE